MRRPVHTQLLLVPWRCCKAFQNFCLLPSVLQDVLLAILACFPDKQKAVPLRAVCKAWRDLFNSSVHCITIHSNLQLLPKSPSRFPNLRHLCISQTNSTAAKAAVLLLGVPNYQELTMLEISNTWMQVSSRTMICCHGIFTARYVSQTCFANCFLPAVNVVQLTAGHHLDHRYGGLVKKACTPGLAPHCCVCRSHPQICTA